MTATTASLLSVTAVSLISLVGVATLSLSEDRMRRLVFFLVALSAGGLFGDVLFHLLPEIYETDLPITASLFILAGILFSFILEKFLHWGHRHQLEPDCADCDRRQIQPLGYLNLVSDGLHNLIDGIIIGVSYLAGPIIGLTTTLAVIVHEIPQEIGDFGVLLHSGFSRHRALFFNLLSALFAVLGAIIALLWSSAGEQLITVFLPIAAGNFLYIAGSDLVPELHKTVELKKSLLQFVAFLLGLAAMLLLLLIE